MSQATNKYGFTPAEVEYQLTHPDETKGPMIMAVVGTFSALATISVVLRILVRRLNKNGFQGDDYTLFTAFILSWCSFVAYHYRTQNGDGMHLLVITPEMSHRYGIAFYSGIIFYVLAQMFTQISLLLLYKRVFTLYRIWFRNTLAVIAFLALTSNISMVLANVFACSPISAAWDKNSVTIHCIDITRLAITHAALTLVVDAAIVIAPLPLVWSLNTDRQTKVAVSGMILLGSLVCIVNPIKIYYFSIPFHGDVTYDADVAPDIWVHVQICLGIVGATLPCLKPLFRGFRGVFSSRDHSASAPTSGGNIRSARSAKGSAPDQYKTLEGEEPSLAESDIGLVPLQQWSASPSFPGHSSSVHTKSMIEGGIPRSTDVEQALSSNEIGVTRDIDVSSSRRAE